MERTFSIEEMGLAQLNLYLEHQESLDRYLGWFRENEPAAYRRFL